MGQTDSTFWDILAVDAYKNLLRQQPNNPLLINNLGIAYRRLGRIKKAIAAFRKTIRNSKKNREAYYHLAVTLRDAGDADAAAVHFEKYRQLTEAEGLDAHIVEEELYHLG